MSKELVISANRHETKLAILEDDQLVEVFFQRSNEYSLAGSIHKGRVTRVLPGMQSAFVDLGLERDTFLYVSDFFEENEEFDRVSVGREDRPQRSERGQRSDRSDRPDRSERPDRTERPDRQAREPQASAAVEETAVAAEVDADLATPALEPSAGGMPKTERSGDRDGQDRHGRRSRRRRNRGRGFPESKYASADSRDSRSSSESRPPRPAEAAPDAELAAVESEVAPPSGDFSILPGESLAKYRGAGIQPLDEGEEDEIRGLQESDTVAAEAAEQEPTPEVAPDASVPIVDTAIVTSAPTYSPVHTHPETHAASEPEVLAVTEVETVFETVETEVETAPSQESVAEPFADDEPAAEEGDIEIEAAAESDLAAEAQAAAEAGEGGDPSASMEGQTIEGQSGEGQAGEPAPLTAQVREQGGRYMHRGPRRMRRKMRGSGGGGVQDRGGAPDPRYDQSHRDDSIPSPAGDAAPMARPEPPRSVSRPDKAPLPSITDLLKEGQEIIVQIAKEPLGQKGARITSHIALPGRYVVYMPTVDHTGVSRKIASDDERLRLKRILLAHHAGAPGGFIVRTAGEGKSEEDIASDMNFLYNLWMDIRQKAEKRPAPLLLHHDLDIVQRTLRDQFTENFKAVWVDNEELYESVLRFVQRFHPSLVTRVKLYTRPEPIFDAFNVTTELEKALRPKVWLKSGGYIVINQTEALVAIDVNTGKYVGRSNRLEDTIVKTNTEAVKEIVRQIRLRDLGGIIVVDFIDMDERKNRQKVMQVLEEAMHSDRAPNKILQFNDFGLVAITRKRVKQSLERALCMPCPHCEGAGYVKSVQTIVNEILQEAQKIGSVLDGKDVQLRVHPDVAKMLKSSQNKYLEELEDVLRRPVLVRSDPALHHEKFDLA